MPPSLSTISLSFSTFTFLHQQSLLLWNIRIDLNVEAGSGFDLWPNLRTSICSIPPPNSKEIRWCWPRPLWEYVRHCDSDLHDLQLLSSSKFLCFEHSGDLAQEIQMDFRKWKGEQKTEYVKKGQIDTIASNLNYGRILTKDMKKNTKFDCLVTLLLFFTFSLFPL